MRAVLGLGANLGDRMAVLAGAITALARTEGVAVTAVSSLYETVPVGGPVQDDFLNIVAVVDTTLSPRQLLDVCQSIEAAFHRTREVRWGPRTLDIDIVAYGDMINDDPDLTLPHPRAADRSFVCVPWVEVDPDAVLPGVGQVAGLAASNPSGDVVRWTPPSPWPPPTSEGSP